MAEGGRERLAKLLANSDRRKSVVDPFTALPSAAGGFCCDQVVLYEPSRDIWIWILQYLRSGTSWHITGRKSNNRKDGRYGDKDYRVP